MAIADDAMLGRVLAALLEHPSHSGWAPMMGDDCHLRIANQPPAIEKIGSLRQLMALFSAIDSVGSEFLDYWSCDDTVLVETELGFRTDTGRACSMPCVVIIRHTSQLIRDIRVLIDPHPIRHRLLLH